MQTEAAAEHYAQLLAEAKGENGSAPEHEWSGTKLRFRNPDGTWGKWVDLRGKRGEKGSAGADGRTFISGCARFDPSALPMLPGAAQSTDDLIIERDGQAYRIPLSALHIAPGTGQGVTVDGTPVTVNGSAITVGITPNAATVGGEIVTVTI